MKVADVDNDGDVGSGDEGGKKKKTPNLSRTLKSRLQRLVEKTDDEYALSRVLSRIMCPHHDPLGDAFSLQNLWNSPARNCGLVTTKSSRNLNVLRASLYAFPAPNSRADLTSPSEKIKAEGISYECRLFQGCATRLFERDGIQLRSKSDS